MASKIRAEKGRCSNVQRSCNLHSDVVRAERQKAPARSRGLRGWSQWRWVPPLSGVSTGSACSLGAACTPGLPEGALSRARWTLWRIPLTRTPPPPNRVYLNPLDHLLSGRLPNRQVPARPAPWAAHASLEPPRRSPDGSARNDRAMVQDARPLVNQSLESPTPGVLAVTAQGDRRGRRHHFT